MPASASASPRRRSGIRSWTAGIAGIGAAIGMAVGTTGCAAIAAVSPAVTLCFDEVQSRDLMLSLIEAGTFPAGSHLQFHRGEWTGGFGVGDDPAKAIAKFHAMAKHNPRFSGDGPIFMGVSTQRAVAEELAKSVPGKMLGPDVTCTPPP